MFFQSYFIDRIWAEKWGERAFWPADFESLIWNKVTLSEIYPEIIWRGTKITNFEWQG